MPITQTMSADHHRCDRLFAEAEQAAADGQADSIQRFEQFVAAMQAHFDFEETVLFPGFEAATGSSAGPTQVMRHEHEQMRALFADIAAALQAGDHERGLDQCESLLIIMQQHNLKEEQILYPMAEQVLAENGETLVRDFEAAAFR